MKSLVEAWGRIEALREDLEELGVDVRITIGVHPEGRPEVTYAEIAERLRRALESLEAEG